MTHPVNKILLITSVLAIIMPSATAADPIADLKATGHDSRIDLVWSWAPNARYEVYRATGARGPFEKCAPALHDLHVYSDFLGENDRRLFYRVNRIDSDGETIGRSRIVSAKTRAMNDDELLDSVQLATWRYFWEFGHPVSGMAREGLKHPRTTVTTGGTGFGMMAIIVGVERGFITREQAADRLLKIVRFLQDSCSRYHGMWSHWINGATGETIHFAGKRDNGGDIVESSLLMQGMLCVRSYFDAETRVESELRRRITNLWHEMEWDWYLREPEGRVLYWHWSPDYGWAMNHRIHGFNECMITYVLAMASPTHPIPLDAYERGWIHDASRYAPGGRHFGIKQIVGRPMGGPLFFTHYSFLGLDPKKVTDRFCNYFENNRNLTLINRAYCIANPKGHKGFGRNVWGLTSSQNPAGYKAHSPSNDDGTIAPTAALSAMPYTPKHSLVALKSMYHALGARIWGPFGFHDAFNLSRDWVSDSFLAIDQGPIVIMIENHRTGLLWRHFMAIPEIVKTVERIPR